MSKIGFPPRLETNCGNCGFNKIKKENSRQLIMPEAKVKLEQDAATTKDKEGGDSKKKGYHFIKKGQGRVISTKFEGKCEEIKGSIYDCSDAKQADVFVKITKDIAAANMAVTELWKESVKQLGKRMNYFQENKNMLYALVWGQCTDILHQKLVATEFTDAWEQGQGLQLLNMIKNITYSFQSQKCPGQSLFDAKRRFYNQTQGCTVTVKEYFIQFQNLVNVLKHSSGNNTDDKGMETFVLDNSMDKSAMTAEELTALASDVENRLLGVAFLMCADRHRFGRLIEGIEDDFIEGRDRYPTSVSDAYRRLANYTYGPRLGQREVGGGKIAFVKAHGERKQGKARNKDLVTCHRCR
jgi:hypothetical protein